MFSFDSPTLKMVCPFTDIHTYENINANHKKELLLISTGSPITATLRPNTLTLYSGGSKFNS